jgi:hypothetical protein
MPFDPELLERMRAVLSGRKGVIEKKMFGVIAGCSTVTCCVALSSDDSCSASERRWKLSRYPGLVPHRWASQESQCPATSGFGRTKPKAIDLSTGSNSLPASRNHSRGNDRTIIFPLQVAAPRFGHVHPKKAASV